MPIIIRKTRPKNMAQNKCISGESLWNKENRFTGWVDVPLTDFGREQAEKAGESIKKEGMHLQAI